MNQKNSNQKGREKYLQKNENSCIRKNIVRFLMNMIKKQTCKARIRNPSQNPRINLTVVYHFEM